MTTDPSAQRRGVGDATIPDSAEIVANLWYVHDAEGFIYSLRIQLYVCAGSGESKLGFLRSRAYLDYLVARVFPLPERFHTGFMDEAQHETCMPVIHHDAAISVGGLDQLFSDALNQMAKDLPAQTHLDIPESPLTGLWALSGDDDGTVIPTDAKRELPPQPGSSSI